jgi:putative mRNA 3-end processing factor
MAEPLVSASKSGLYCAAGDFHIDPWEPVARAVVTHCHADHARAGCDAYLTLKSGGRLLQHRLGAEASIQTLENGEAINIKGVKVSLHPAGHILGSAQIRMEYEGKVWVVGGDYKTSPDPTCDPFEPLACDVFVTESTFGLPIYRWPSQDEVMSEINQWWNRNRKDGATSMLFAYAAGKAQRVLAGIDVDIGPVFTHGAVESINRLYRDSGIPIPNTLPVGDGRQPSSYVGSLILAPPSAAGSLWMRRFRRVSTGLASGWMRIRGIRRRRAIDRGFVLSDHADWPSLLQAIEATGATTVFVTHGYIEPMVRFLREKGFNARAMQTDYPGERAELR